MSRLATVALVALALTACSDPGGDVTPTGDTVGGGGADFGGVQDMGPTPDDGTMPPDNGTTPPDNGTTPPDNGTTPPDNGTTPPDNGTTPVTRVCTDAELSAFTTCVQACASGDTTCQQGCASNLSQACAAAYVAFAQCAQAAGCAADDAQCALTNCPDEAAAVFGEGPAPSDCDPVAGTGCDAGEICTYVSQGELGCAAPGTAGLDEDCNNVGCTSGACLSLDGTNYTCFQFCSPTNNQCPDGRPCNVALEGTSETVCGDIPQACDIFAQDCAAPQGCYLIDAAGNTDCSPHNGGAAGSACTYLNDCSPGFICAGPAGSTVCSAVCATDGSVTCAAGTCNSIGVGTIGACSGS